MDGSEDGQMDRWLGSLECAGMDRVKTLSSKSWERTVFNYLISSAQVQHKETTYFKELSIRYFW